MFPGAVWDTLLLLADLSDWPSSGVGAPEMASLMDTATVSYTGAHTQRLL